MNDITSAFHEYFEIVIANTQALKNEVFSLRYQVLCIHEGIPGFQADNYPDGQEKDEYDDYSIHLLLRHRSSNSFIGTTRLIMANDLNISQKFPMELYSQFYKEYVNIQILRKHTTEISRFIIRSDFFKRKEDSRFLDDNNLMGDYAKGRRRFPHPMLALAVGVIQLCAKNDIYYWLSSMNPALNRLLNFYGMQFDPIGPLVNHHGLRRPYYVCLLDVLERMYTNHREIWELVTDNGRIWPAKLEHLKIISAPRQDKPNTDISIMTC
ncbi:PEP-CTERM/exosortase system-associated acyltransferase [Nitrosomonas sp. Nm34]|uniref:PEP-CTERM/exosortase system-associated acyltransferase n=1 Tax=Nitrosomonas sp. Nm34 TaxID=1881055 RepID=UPI0008E6A078|nr:PEP-CTERM/exosortase system-associated acyltransferase [Nitrosomonas sp. Nm34]SFI96833.1 N-acyl amino acid synthase, PEP-CTERM/exosortase system-associated [Nitrosomonas sp. Nm34]